MKSILILLFAIFSNTCGVAQIYHMTNKYSDIPQAVLNNIDKIGIDESPLLSPQEAECIRSLLSEEIDMSGKKLAFLTGSIRGNKKDFFDIIRKNLKGGDCSRLRYFGTLYVFTLSQKKNQVVMMLQSYTKARS
ncbi:hypothetical protein [Porphyromonas gingivalis]|uniref:hypothetical protein n=1 Tax=Porphyromonas gingivalis TaxID=837 RepID=UPI0012FD8334|nr:hypothetical protein [Porphyromonas gingivalis]